MSAKPVAFGMDGNSVTINGMEIGPACRHVEVTREAGDSLAVVKLEFYANQVMVAPRSFPAREPDMAPR